MNSNARRVAVEGDMVFQRREWRTQRIAWMLAMVLLIMALLGVFSVGPLSWASARASSGLQLEYERFARQFGQTELAMSIAPEAVRQTEIRVQVSQDYLDTVVVQKVTPEPSTVIGEADKLTYVFEVGDAAVPLKVSFNLQPEQMGLQHVEVGLADASSTRFWQFVYP